MATTSKEEFTEIKRKVRESRHRRSETQRLLEKARAGDSKAIRQLRERIHDYLSGKFRSKSPGGIADTEDLVQEVEKKFFLKGLKEFEYRGKGSLEAYVSGIARRSLFDQYRAKHKSSMAARDWDPNVLPDHGTGPATNAQRQDELAYFHEYFFRHIRKLLPPKYIEAAILHYKHQLPWEILGTEFGEKPDTLRRRIKRAIDKIAPRHY